MGSTSDFRNGAIIKYKGDNCIIVDFQHVKPGKGGAFYQVKMRNMMTGKMLENRFRSGESVDLVRVERRTYQFLYRDGTNLIFMNNDTYEQIPVEAEKMGDQIQFLKESQDCTLSFEDEMVLAAELPPHINLRVEATEPGFKGDTATNVMKPATVETGAIIQVPLFINEGDLLRVDTSNGSYIERVKG